MTLSTLILYNSTLYKDFERFQSSFKIQPSLSSAVFARSLLLTELTSFEAGFLGTVGYMLQDPCLFVQVAVNFCVQLHPSQRVKSSTNLSCHSVAKASLQVLLLT